MPAVFQRIRSKFPLISAVTWGLLILYLTLRPKSDRYFISLPTWLAGLPIDKIAHFVFWGIWYILYEHFYLKRPHFTAAELSSNMAGVSSGNLARLARKERLFGIGVMIFFGALIEIAQHQLKWGREAEWADLAADTAGVLIAALIYKTSGSVNI